MNTTKVIASAAEVKRLVQVLKSCIDRRFPPDEIIDSALSRVDRQADTLIDLIKEK